MMCSSKMYLLILEVIMGGGSDGILWEIDSDGIIHIQSLTINLLKQEYSNNTTKVIIILT